MMKTDELNAIVLLEAMVDQDCNCVYGEEGCGYCEKLEEALWKNRNDLIDAARGQDMELRSLRTKARRLGDETRCTMLLGMAMGSLRCGRPEGHDGEHQYFDPSIENEELRVENEKYKALEAEQISVVMDNPITCRNGEQHSLVDKCTWCEIDKLRVLLKHRVR